MAAKYDKKTDTTIITVHPSDFSKALSQAGVGAIPKDPRKYSEHIEKACEAFEVECIKQGISSVHWAGVAKYLRAQSVDYHPFANLKYINKIVKVVVY